MIMITTCAQPHNTSIVKQHIQDAPITEKILEHIAIIESKQNQQDSSKTEESNNIVEKIIENQVVDSKKESEYISYKIDAKESIDRINKSRCISCGHIGHKNCILYDYGNYLYEYLDISVFVEYLDTIFNNIEHDKHRDLWERMRGSRRYDNMDAEDLFYWIYNCDNKTIRLEFNISYQNTFNESTRDALIIMSETSLIGTNSFDSYSEEERKKVKEYCLEAVENKGLFDTCSFLQYL